MVDFSVLLTRISRRYGAAVWVVTVVLCVLSLLSVFHRGFNTNLLNLIPREARKTHLYLKLIRDFGMMEETYIILDGEILANIDAIERFAEDLRKSGLVKDVRYRLDPEVIRYLSEMFRKKAFLFLDDSGLDQALSVLRPENMARRVRKLRTRLLMPSKPVSMTDPLGFSEQVLGRMPSMDMPFDAASGLLLSNNGTRLFIILQPAGEARDISFDTDLLRLINDSFERRFRGINSVSMGVTGSHAITYHEQKIMKRDMQVNIVAAFVCVSLIFIIFFRTIRGMIYAFVPVIMAIVLTTGLAAWIFGSMSEISGAFGAMLVGLGVDLCIVLYMRHIVMRDIEQSVRATASAIWTGVLTTAATFLPMTYSAFRGIRELGFMTATGIVICAVLIFSLSSAMMSGGRAMATRHTGIEALAPLSLRHRKAAVVLSILLLGLASYSLRGITFSADLSQLGARDNKARELFASLGLKRGSIFITGTAGSVADVVRRSAEVSSRLEKAGIHNVLSLASFVPAPDQQKRNIDRIRSIDVERVVRLFSDEARAQGFSEDHIALMAQNIRGFFSVRRPLVIDDFRGTAMEDFLRRFYGREGDVFRYIVMVNEDAAVPDMPAGVEITGPAEAKRELSSMLRDSAAVITTAGILLVNIILLVRFRRLLLVLFAQIPVAVAIVITGAAMNLMGMQIHVMNAIVIVMLFGIGTDYAIHLIHHILQSGDMEAVTRGTGRAVSVAAYTTIAGFGSIYFSSYRGLSEMGLAVTIGCILTLAFSLALIPVFMGRWLEEKAQGETGSCQEYGY